MIQNRSCTDDASVVWLAYRLQLLHALEFKDFLRKRFITEQLIAWFING